MAAAIAGALFLQADAKETKGEAAAGAAQPVSMWKLAARAGVRKGW